MKYKYNNPGNNRLNSPMNCMIKNNLGLSAHFHRDESRNIFKYYIYISLSTISFIDKRLLFKEFIKKKREEAEKKYGTFISSKNYDENRNKFLKKEVDRKLKRVL